MKQDEARFHSERAMAELDLALSASTVSAARAHFELSALHLKKMQSLNDMAPAASAQS